MPIPNSASATYPAQAEPDALDFDVVQAGMNGTGVLSGCACTPASSGSTLGVAVAVGSVVVAGTVVAVTSGTVTPGAASGTNPRFDLVVVNNAGTKSIIAGTAAASPVFPAAAPATYAVLCAVWIPTSATSITAGNIVDKRQLINADATAATPSPRTLGAGSTQAAAGDHNHAGNYASTVHGATHAGAGSDPVTALSPLTIDQAGGQGYVALTGQSTDVGAPADSTTLRLHNRWVGNHSELFVKGINHLTALDAIDGPTIRFLVLPSATTAVTSMFGPAPTVTNVTHPTPTTQYGWHFNIASTVSANTRGNVDTHLAWLRGDINTRPWVGARAAIRACFPDSSYANTGATTGTRALWGFTDQAATVLDNADNPTGTRFCFQYINVNGGRLQTTFNITCRDGTTESVTNTGVSLTQNKWYDFYLHMYPWGACDWQIDDVEAMSILAQGNTTLNIPLETTLMRFVVTMRTINAVARNMKIQRISISCPAV